MISREYYKKYYDKHRDIIRTQTKARVSKWRKNHKKQYLESRRTEEYHEKRRKNLLYYYNLKYQKTGTNQWPPLIKAFLQIPLREIVKDSNELETLEKYIDIQLQLLGIVEKDKRREFLENYIKEQRQFLNKMGYSLKRLNDKPNIVWHLLDIFIKQYSLEFTSNITVEKLLKNDKSIVIEGPDDLKPSTLKHYDVLLRDEAKNKFLSAGVPESKFEKVYQSFLKKSGISKDIEELNEELKNDYVKYGRYQCKHCRSTYSRLQDLKYHIISKHIIIDIEG